MSEPSSSEIAAAYDQWAETYETSANATRDLASAALRRELALHGGLDVLEIGCGTGVNTRWIAEGSRSVLAIDFSSGMLEQARVNVASTNVRFQQQDLRTEWAIPDSSVDLVVCSLVLEHIEDLGHVYAEAARVLRAGGEFFLCELHPFRQLRGRQAEFVDPASGDRVLVRAYVHDFAEYLNTAIRNGFTVRQVDEWRSEATTKEPELPRIVSIRLGVAK